MSSSKDSGGGISKNVLTLEGTSNYHAWLATIWSFLMTLKVWRIASGESTCSTAAGPDQNTWLDLDYQAVRVISLYIKEDLRTAVILTYEDPKTSLAFCTLANLVSLYAATGPTSQFYLFRDIVNWHLGGTLLSVFRHCLCIILYKPRLCSTSSSVQISRCVLVSSPHYHITDLIPMPSNSTCSLNSFTQPSRPSPLSRSWTSNSE